MNIISKKKHTLFILLILLWITQDFRISFPLNLSQSLMAFQNSTQLSSLSTKKTTTPPKKSNKKKSPISKKKVTSSISLRTLKNISTPYEGLWALYQHKKNGKVYLKLAKKNLKKAFIYFSMIQDAPLDVSLFRGNYSESFVFKLKRYYQDIHFIKQILLSMIMKL